MGRRGRNERKEQGKVIGKKNVNILKNENRKEETVVVLWNIKELKGKETDFWDYVEVQDVVGLLET